MSALDLLDAFGKPEVEECLNASDLNVSRASGCDALCERSKTVDGCQEDFCSGTENLPLTGERRVWLPDEERGSEVSFELLDFIAERGLGDEEQCCGSAEMQGVCERDKVSQAPNTHFTHY